MYTTFNRNKQRLHRHIRIRGKISGTALRPRISVFRSNKFIYASLIDDEKAVTLASSSSAKLGLDNPSNVDAAKQVGLDLAKKAKALNITKAVFDRSGYAYHGQVQAVAEGAREGGLVF